MCSSYAGGLATAEKLLSGSLLDDEEMELELGDENLEFVEEVRQLQAIIDVLSPHATDPKLDAALYYLLKCSDPWLAKGCIIFSQYFDTAKWVGEANAFDLRYTGDVTPKGDRWEFCEKALARHDVKQRLSRGWGERERAEPAGV